MECKQIMTRFLLCLAAMFGAFNATWAGGHGAHGAPAAPVAPVAPVVVQTPLKISGVVIDLATEITLESESAKKDAFVLPASVAFQSPLIQQVVKQTVEQGSPIYFIKFDDIPAQDLKLMVDAMTIMSALPDEPLFSVMFNLENNLELPKLISLDLFNQAAFLQLKPFETLLARYIATAIHDGKIAKDVVFGNFTKPLNEEISQQYYNLYQKLL
ncbi:MAG: hypothetical protein NTX86_00860 [Candidatus Dependentiae bacterium]|nr:hypothetical protein [Candidatus Dependentiae bacterium]